MTLCFNNLRSTVPVPELNKIIPELKNAKSKNFEILIDVNLSRSFWNRLVVQFYEIDILKSS